LSDGDLLAAAEAEGFDVFVSANENLWRQQNRPGAVAGGWPRRPGGQRPPNRRGCLSSLTLTTGELTMLSK